MFVIVDDADLRALSSAIAKNLGADRAAVQAALAGSLGIPEPMSDEQTGRIDEGGFRNLLAAGGVEIAAGEPILAAAIVAVPRSLRGADHPEGMLAALARELGHDRSRFELGEDEDDLALSANFRHAGGNDFDCDVAAREDYEMTVWTRCGTDAQQVRAILARDLGALRGLVCDFDTGWIENYLCEADESLVHGDPAFTLGIVVDGVDVNVWPGAARYHRYDSVGTIVETKVIAIDGAEFHRIDQALHALSPCWLHNAFAVGVIREIVPLD